MQYTDAQWYESLRMAWDIEPFIVRQAAMLDAAVPDNDIALIVDEWGLWHQQNGRTPKPGHFLFEQPSNMREAVLAAISLNVFNNHCDRVKMANIAQLVNCIHSLFLAHEDKFVTTTTYHVFDMYQAHYNLSLIHIYFRLHCSPEICRICLLLMVLKTLLCCNILTQALL